MSKTFHCDRCNVDFEAHEAAITLSNTDGKERAFHICVLSHPTVKLGDIQVYETEMTGCAL